MQYPGVQGPAVTQVIKRPMTDPERQLPGNFYKSIQKGLRGISLFCLVLFVLDVYLLPIAVTDSIMLDSFSMTLSVFMVVFGLVAIGMSVNTLVVRNRVEQVMRDGTAIEILAPAYRASAIGKVQAWTVGPISMLPTRGLEGVLQEGAPTRVLCVPRLKAAIAINNIGLRQGARITCPPNLDAMAVPVGFQAAPAPYQPYAPPAPQPVPAEYPDDLPPPPPPD